MADQQNSVTLYDKTGAAFVLDHEHDGVAYVRPMVRVVSIQNYGDDYHEDIDQEPAEYLVTRKRDELFDASPSVVLDADIMSKTAELRDLEKKIEKAKREARGELSRINGEFLAAQRQLDEWMKTHKIMIDLGKLIEGKTLYPLTVSDSSYHTGPDVPRIPDIRNASYLELSGGDWESGKSWRCKRYGSDPYGSSFKFFDTEEERATVIATEFNRACEAFRKNPNFSEEGHTYSTRLDFGRLRRWVETHPSLKIPDDIMAMKSESDAANIEARKAKLAAELAAISGEKVATA